MPSDSIPLDQQLCYTLYATTIAINRAYKPLLDKLGITYPQYLVITALAEEDGRTITAIADRLALEPSTITPLVKRLEQAGLADRRRNKDDERQVQVTLTPKGRALHARTSCLGTALLERSGMTAGDLVALNQKVQSLRAAMTEPPPAEQAGAL